MGNGTGNGKIYTSVIHFILTSYVDALYSCHMATPEQLEERVLELERQYKALYGVFTAADDYYKHRFRNLDSQLKSARAALIVLGAPDDAR